MFRKLALVSLLTVSAVGFSGSQANAAHCVAPLAERADFPGFSYFGRDHVQETTHKEGGNPGPHVTVFGASSGASVCIEATGNPSVRAPGKP